MLGYTAKQGHHNIGASNRGWLERRGRSTESARTRDRIPNPDAEVPDSTVDSGHSHDLWRVDARVLLDAPRSGGSDRAVRAVRPVRRGEARGDRRAAAPVWIR